MFILKWKSSQDLSPQIHYQLLLACIERTLCSPCLGTVYSSMLAKVLKAESNIPFTSCPADAFLSVQCPVTQLLAVNKEVKVESSIARF